MIFLVFEFELLIESLLIVGCGKILDIDNGSKFFLSKLKNEGRGEKDFILDGVTFALYIFFCFIEFSGSDSYSMEVEDVFIS